MRGSLRPPCLQSFNTEVTEILRALRVEGLMVAEYTEPLPGDDMSIRTKGERILAHSEGFPRLVV